MEAQLCIEACKYVEEVEIKIPKLRREISPTPEISRRRRSTEVRGRTFKFSGDKRNFITDSLFAGNIYVGGAEDEGGDTEPTVESVERFSSWRDKFDKKMHS